MSFPRSLRGGCQCGRNRYIIQMPEGASNVARVLFDSHPSHRVSLASPMASFLKVPLTWYRSATFAHFPDETNAMIHRVYTSPREQHAMRHFCGFCGTPLSYWSEEPRTEADYIQLTLGSLHNEDLGDLEDLGLIPDSEGSSRAASPPPPADVVMSEASPEQSELGRQVANRGHREVFGGIPWFDSLVEGSRLSRRLGNVRASKGSGQSRDGSVRYEWEVVEYTEGEGDDGNDTSRSGKRKLDDRDSGEVSSVVYDIGNA